MAQMDQGSGGETPDTSLGGKKALGYGLAGIGGAGLLSGLLSNNDMPAAPEAQLSPATMDAMNRQFQRSMQSEGQIQGEYMHGTEGAKNLLNTSVPGGVATGEHDDAAEQAIQNRAQRAYQHDLDKLQNQVRLQSVTDKASMLDQAHKSFMMKAQIDINNYKAKMQRYQAEQQARNQVISSLLGVAGFGAGLALAGPVGGAVGGGLGAAAGSTINDQGMGGET